MAIFSISFLVLSLLTLSPKPTSSFSFPSFHKTPSFDSQIALFGDATIVDTDSSIQITQPSISSSGLIIYTKPISFFNRNPRKIASFSTYFSFSISPGSDGINFIVFPAKSHFAFDSPGLLPGMGSDWVLAFRLNASFAVVESDCPNSKCGGMVRICDLSALNLGLDGQKLHSWIDYDSGLKKLEVRLSISGLLRPFDPVVSYSMDLQGMLKGEMFVGISSSSVNSTKKSWVYSWSFELKRDVSSMHSKPVDPRAFLVNSRRGSVPRRSGYVWRILTALGFGAGCGVVIAFLVLFVWSVLVDRQSLRSKEYPLHPVPVDFEYEKIVAVAIKDTDVGKK